MKIFNVRLGHANNSSSKHSIILFPPDKLPKDSSSGKSTNMHQEFGWGNFTLSSRARKRDYLAATLYGNLTDLMHDDLAAIITSAWMEGIEIEQDPDGYRAVGVDHQSEIALPLAVSDETHKILDRQFFRELSEYILREGVVILGGNDNDEHPHPLAGAGPHLLTKIPTDSYSVYFLARKDEALGYWTIFNQKSGAKIRLSFSDDTAAPVKATYPEMVDLKITDRCHRLCDFCYQGSGVNGAHADSHYVNNVIHLLGRAKVFEIAIGGGEPTEHPNFDHFLIAAKSQGINANFTTATLDWLRDPTRRRVILENSRSFAYSVQNAEDVDRLVAAVTEYSPPGDDTHYGVQCVLGVVDPDEARSIIERAQQHHLPVTLLGAKDTGRGAKYKFAQWDREADFRHAFGLDRLSRYNMLESYDPWGSKLSIDTSAAKVWAKWLKKYKVAPILYETTEGAFNCYIDAVNQTIAASSYIGEPQPFELPVVGLFPQFTLDYLRDKFAGISVV